MTKILCVGDIHAMDRAPVNAAESYMDDIIEMLTWTIRLAAEQKYDAIVWAGDIFHHKSPSRTSHALVLRMISLIHLAKELGVELIAVTGNHDISNDVLASIQEKQPLGVLYAAGLRELVGWHKTLPLYGVPWRQDWTTNENSAWEAFKDWRQTSGPIIGEEDIVDPIDITRALAVTHAPIYPPKEAENIQWELVPTMGDKGISAAMGGEGFLYYGHIHEDHGIFKVRGVTYANMGAISRGSLHEYNLERQIKVALWTEDGFTEIVVPHKPASEVFKIAQAEDKKTERRNLDEFLREIGSSSLDVSSTGSVVEHIRGREDVSPRVRKTAIEIVEEIG
jgi:Icc-related predicted phosphoesterase